MASQDDLTISERLARIGFGHRATEETWRSGGRQIFALTSGEPIGHFSAAGAVALLREAEAAA